MGSGGKRLDVRGMERKLGAELGMIYQKRNPPRIDRAGLGERD